MTRTNDADYDDEYSLFLKDLQRQEHREEIRRIAERKRSRSKKDSDDLLEVDGDDVVDEDDDLVPERTDTEKEQKKADVDKGKPAEKQQKTASAFRLPSTSPLIRKVQRVARPFSNSEKEIVRLYMVTEGSNQVASRLDAIGKGRTRDEIRGFIASAEGKELLSYQENWFSGRSPPRALRGVKYDTAAAVYGYVKNLTPLMRVVTENPTLPIDEVARAYQVFLNLLWMQQPDSAKSGVLLWRFTFEEIAEILIEYASGKHYKEIAAAYNATVPSSRRVGAERIARTLRLWSLHEGELT